MMTQHSPPARAPRHPLEGAEVRQSSPRGGGICEMTGRLTSSRLHAHGQTLRRGAEKGNRRDERGPRSSIMDCLRRASCAATEARSGGEARWFATRCKPPCHVADTPARSGLPRRDTTDTHSRHRCRRSRHECLGYRIKEPGRDDPRQGGTADGRGLWGHALPNGPAWRGAGALAQAGTDPPPAVDRLGGRRGSRGRARGPRCARMVVAGIGLIGVVAVLSIPLWLLRTVVLDRSGLRLLRRRGEWANLSWADLRFVQPTPLGKSMLIGDGDRLLRVTTPHAKWLCAAIASRLGLPR